ncbi:uncharacterized protein LOC144216600 [Crocuta crocuta]
MEPETSAQSSPGLDEDHPLPVSSDETNTGFCDQSVIYSDVKAHRSSNIGKRKRTRHLKTNARCLEEVLMSYENDSAHCKVI